MRPTQAQIDIEALRHNLKLIAGRVGSKVGIIPVVKADAYGHGVISVSWALAEAGVQIMAVATLDEALELVEAGIPSRLLILGGITGETQIHDMPVNCIPIVWDEDGLNFANTLPEAAGRPIEVHIKVDTGMTRLGCYADNLPRLLEIASGLENLRVTGVMSHLSSADLGDEKDEKFTSEQVLHFRHACRQTPMGILRHLCASAAIVKYPDAHFDAVRPGIMLYGIWPFADFKPINGVDPKDLKPVMSFRSAVLSVKDTKVGSSVSYGRTYKVKEAGKIAVVPAGYADGISRKLSNRGQVLIGGKRRNILGTVTMDYIMVDVSESPGTLPGDEVVILGGQGDEEISAWEIARWAETIPYEVVCDISRRVTRITFDEIGRR